MPISVIWLCSDDSEFPLMGTDFPSLYPVIDSFLIFTHLSFTFIRFQCRWLIRLTQRQADIRYGPDFPPPPVFLVFVVCQYFERPTAPFAQMMDQNGSLKSPYTLCLRDVSSPEDSNSRCCVYELKTPYPAASYLQSPWSGPEKLCDFMYTSGWQDHVVRSRFQPVTS
jgi:hypothetical protein